MALPTLYTIGYEDADLHDFLATLVEAHVDVVVDTRERAQSRRKGFSKTALSDALLEQGIRYQHYRSLGTPPATRKAYRLSHDFNALSKEYDLHLATQTDTLQDLGTLASQSRVALLCYEHEPGECHRSLIASRMKEMQFIDQITDLKPPRRSRGK